MYDIWSKHLNSRLWMPGHVETEFNSNRESVINKIFSENYPVLIQNMETITKGLEKLNENWKVFDAKVVSEEQHPVIEKSKLETCKDALKMYIEAYHRFEEDLRAQVDDKAKQIALEISNDDLLNAINSYFEKGSDYSYDEMINIIKNEGIFRYSISIPPGYKDSNKSGLQVYGDLYIWKQILSYAHNKKKPIIFVCDDLKEDWCLKEKHNPERIEEPRLELIKEISDFAKVDFWMYSLSQFIYLSSKYFSTNVDTEIINAIDNRIIKSMVFTMKDIPYSYLHHVPEGWTVTDIDSRNHSLFVTNGKIGGSVPYDEEPDRSWFCGVCHQYGPWNGNRCLTCGNLQSIYD